MSTFSTKQMSKFLMSLLLLAAGLVSSCPLDLDLAGGGLPTAVLVCHWPQPRRILLLLLLQLSQLLCPHQLLAVHRAQLLIHDLEPDAVGPPRCPPPGRPARRWSRAALAGPRPANRRAAPAGRAPYTRLTLRPRPAQHSQHQTRCGVRYS